MNGGVKGQQDQPWAHDNAVGGGQQTVTNGNIIRTDGEVPKATKPQPSSVQQPITDPSRLLSNPAKNSNTGEVDPEYKSPELENTIKSYPAPKGLKVQMALDESYQIDPVKGTVKNLGQFTTKDKITSVEQVRKDLAVKPEFKSRVTHVQEF